MVERPRLSLHTPNHQNDRSQLSESYPHTPNRQNDRDQFSENDTFHTPNRDQSSGSYLLDTPNSQNNRDQFSESDDAEGSNKNSIGAGLYLLLSFANFYHH
jgi:hypothetical protein